MPAALGAKRLNPSSPASVAYLNHLASRQNAVKTAMDLALGRSVSVKFRYSAAYNGMAVQLTATESQRVAALPGVKRVQPDQLNQLLTDVGPAWIGANGIYDGTATGGLPGTKGEGIVVGIVDTGINHDHPSFADLGGDGFNHTNPRTRHYGVCAPLNVVLCNDKLIGMYDFTGTTPFDDNAHGSHTASTVAGNVLTATLDAPTIDYTKPISGVAPHANIIAYKACTSLPAVGGCLASGTVAAINQATLDMVHVINFSIGGASRNPWTDPNAIAFLGANAAGVFGSVSAGNDGPGSSTIGSPSDAPWVMSVGASTHNRSLLSQLTDMVGGAAAPPAAITGASVAAGVGPASIVYAGAPPYNTPLCGAGTADPTTGVGSEPAFDPGELAGKIVVCDRGTYGRVAKGQEVKNAGGIGMVLANDAASGDSLTADMHVLPALHITHDDGVAVKAWLAGGGTDHTARITGLQENTDAANGDVMASFSSRGPNPSVPGVIKPDVTAPGVDIYAAFNTPLTSVPPTAPEYGIISGTSMSSPHAAGAVALLRALKPTWTPSQLKSALMTTGFTAPPGRGRRGAPGQQGGRDLRGRPVRHGRRPRRAPARGAGRPPARRREPARLPEREPGPPDHPGRSEDAEHRVDGERELPDVLHLDAHGDELVVRARDLDGLGGEPVRRDPHGHACFLHARPWREPDAHDHGHERQPGAERVALRRGDPLPECLEHPGEPAPGRRSRDGDQLRSLRRPVGDGGHGRLGRPAHAHRRSQRACVRHRVARGRRSQPDARRQPAARSSSGR